MKLVKIFFDAYRSLLEKELEINEDCIGFVGSNESGKSNIILAVNILSEEKQLTILDTPKMDKTKNPSLRFRFKLNEKEINEINEIIKDWQENKTLYVKEIQIPTEITYNITFNKETEEELRYFTIDDVKVDSNLMFLKFDKVDNEDCKIFFDNKYRSIANSIIINNKDLEKDKTLIDAKQLETLIKEIASEEELISGMKTQVEKQDITVDPNNPTPADNKTISDTENSEIINKQKTIDSLEQQKETIEKRIIDYNILQLTKEQLTFIEDCKTKTTAKETEKSGIVKKISELEKVTPQTDVQKNELIVLKKNLSSVTKGIENLNEDIKYAEFLIEEMNEPLHEKYVSDISELQKHINSIILPQIKKYIPKVVYWEHNNKYILKSETAFSDIMDKKNINDVSRPLANIFLLGLGTKTFEEIKSKIKEIQNDPNERSRLARTLNNKINEYIKKVWGDYDQEILISLEKEQIRIEFYDPKKEDASYYNMEERSQGCRAFLSFLLTIGAEAKHGVIKNTVLLLDEPETHLHPSGARFMLQELIKISENGNLVLYATHSIFLIDRNNLNRHIILKKEKEKTIIIPANVGRVGYLMQEEVLYKALDVNINSDFNSSKDNNFVFEGDGDVALFDFYYEKILKETNRPFKLSSTALFQGGKCNDILKYFTQSPIHLTSKWIFILDKDAPADKLKSFIEGKYKDYLNKDVFIFQYSKPSLAGKDIELEDILPKELMIKSYMATFEFLNIDINIKTIQDIINKSSYYADYDEGIIALVESKLQSEFKGKLKEILNSNIKGLFKEIKDENKFNEVFPDYSVWVKSIFEEIKPKKEQQQPTKAIPNKGLSGSSNKSTSNKK